jgi:hypothetical protein
MMRWLAGWGVGLDAARAIGPKLAEQAVLVRSDGSVQDLRAPLEEGQQIQILTTRDKQDPDALYVLRHSTAHLLAEAVRRLYPGVKIAIGPPIENGFYYDFEFPEPIHEADLEKIEAELYNELKILGVDDHISFNMGLVKEIGYYTGVVFDITVDGVGYFIGSGGRYDNLIGCFGKDSPAIGFAFGVERLLLALDVEREKTKC